MNTRPYSLKIRLVHTAENLIHNLKSISNCQTNFNPYDSNNQTNFNPLYKISSIHNDFNPFCKISMFTRTFVHFVKFRIFTPTSIHFVKFRVFTLISIYFVKFQIFTLISTRFINFWIKTSTSIHITRKLKILHFRILWLLYINKFDKFIFQKRGLKAIFSPNHWAAICRIHKNPAFWLAEKVLLIHFVRIDKLLREIYLLKTKDIFLTP